VNAYTPVASGPPAAALDNGNWTGNATLSSSANAFAGTFAMDGTTDYSGSLTGRFFGPAAEEVGAVIQASAASGPIAIGSLVGARGAGAGASQTGLLDLTTATALLGSDAQFNTTPALSPTQATILNAGIAITYDPVAKTYQFKSSGPGGPGPVPLDRTLSEANRNAAGSNATFTAYQGTGFTARLFNPGPTNPRIALTYTSFAEIVEDVTHDGRATNSQHYVAFGGQTPNFQVPTTGSASYSGVVYGSGRNGLVSNEASLSGTSKFNVNFATNAASMLLDLVATDKVSGVAQDLADITFSGTLGGFCPGGCNRNTFGLPIDPVALPGGSGTMSGQFNGPNAAEFAATFKFDLPASVPGNASSASTFAGATVGKKD
jgi:hypothetical protein